jgi:hypothetical protein
MSSYSEFFTGAIPLENICLPPYLALWLSYLFPFG